MVRAKIDHIPRMEGCDRFGDVQVLQEDVREVQPVSLMYRSAIQQRLSRRLAAVNHRMNALKRPVIDVARHRLAEPLKPMQQHLVGVVNLICERVRRKILAIASPTI